MPEQERKIVKDQWYNPGSSWIAGLMVKSDGNLDFLVTRFNEKNVAKAWDTYRIKKFTDEDFSSLKEAASVGKYLKGLRDRWVRQDKPADTKGRETK